MGKDHPLAIRERETAKIRQRRRRQKLNQNKTPPITKRIGVSLPRKNGKKGPGRTRKDKKNTEKLR